MFQTTFSIHMQVQPSSQTQAKIFFLSLAISCCDTLVSRAKCSSWSCQILWYAQGCTQKSKLQPIQKEQLNYYNFISCKAGHYLHFNFQQVLGLQGISFHRFLDFKHTPHLESCSHSFNLFIGFLGLLGQGGHPCFSTLQIPFCVIRQLLAQLEEIHHVFWFETC